MVGKDFVPLSHKDWSAELTKIRAAKPDAVVVFYPGSWGPKFFTQYAQAGLNKTTPLYHVFSIDMSNMPRFQKAGLKVVGTFQTNQWSPDLPNAANKKFVAGYKKKYGEIPSHFAAQAYETIMLIKSGVDAVEGDVTKMDAMRAALEKADFAAVRGKFKYDINHYPIQDFYAREVIVGKDGKWGVALRGKVVTDSRSPVAHLCKMKK